MYVDTKGHEKRTIFFIYNKLSSTNRNSIPKGKTLKQHGQEIH